jgi:hypothetical protein
MKMAWNIEIKSAYGWKPYEHDYWGRITKTYTSKKKASDELKTKKQYGLKRSWFRIVKVK